MLGHSRNSDFWAPGSPGGELVSIIYSHCGKWPIFFPWEIGSPFNFEERELLIIMMPWWLVTLIFRACTTFYRVARVCGTLVYRQNDDLAILLKLTKYGLRSKCHKVHIWTQGRGSNCYLGNAHLNSDFFHSPRGGRWRPRWPRRCRRPWLGGQMEARRHWNTD